MTIWTLWAAAAAVKRASPSSAEGILTMDVVVVERMDGKANPSTLTVLYPQRERERKRQRKRA